MGEKEFELNLGALDGYKLPDAEDEHEEKVSPKKRKRKPKPQVLGVDYRENEEKRLEQLLFGELVQKFEGEDAEFGRNLGPSNTLLDGGQADIASETIEGGEKTTHKKRKTSSDKSHVPENIFSSVLGLNPNSEKKVAWIDEDDETIRLKDVVAEYNRGKGKHGSKETSEANYKQYLERQFVAIHGQTTPKWAELGRKGVNEEQHELSKTATNLLKKQSIFLPQDIIRVNKVRDLNKESRSEGAIIKSIDFHRTQNAALVAGNSGVITLFQVDGRKNSKVQSIKFDNFPIHRAQFLTDGEEILASSPVTGNIQVYNLMTGKSQIIPHNKTIEKGIYKNFTISPDGKLIAYQGRFGYIHLMAARSKEWLSSLKTNGEVNALTFSPDGSRLYSHGGNADIYAHYHRGQIFPTRQFFAEHGEVHVWDTHSRSCVHKFVDDGCILGTSIAISSTQQYLACGSSSGVVNLYSTSKLENSSSPKPDKVLLNLVTKISGIQFHASSELMSMFSDQKENSVRLVHFPSMTVFKNFPEQSKGNLRINCINFSPNGGYMGLGLNNGCAQLYRFHHYDQY